MDPLEDGTKHREDLHIPVVVGGLFTVGFQVEGVDHIHVIQIRCCCLVGQVHRMLQRQIPDRESLKFGVARLNAPLVLVVELAQAGSHFAAAGAGGGDHHQRMGSFDIFVLAETLVGDDVLDIGGVAGDGVMLEATDAQAFQPLEEGIRRGLTGITGQYNAAHVQAQLPEGVDEPEHIHIIGNAQIAPDFILFNIRSIDGDDNFHIVTELLKHPHFAVRLEAGQDPGGVVVVKELAAEFQIQLAAELADPPADLLGLGRQVFIVVKTDGLHFASLLKTKILFQYTTVSPGLEERSGKTM